MISSEVIEFFREDILSFLEKENREGRQAHHAEHLQTSTITSPAKELVS